MPEVMLARNVNCNKPQLFPSLLNGAVHCREAHSDCFERSVVTAFGEAVSCSRRNWVSASGPAEPGCLWCLLLSGTEHRSSGP
jgi:hypothetical protein